MSRKNEERFLKAVDIMRKRIELLSKDNEKIEIKKLENYLMSNLIDNGYKISESYIIVKILMSTLMLTLTKEKILESGNEK